MRCKFPLTFRMWRQKLSNKLMACPIVQTTSMRVQGYWMSHVDVACKKSIWIVLGWRLKLMRNQLMLIIDGRRWDRVHLYVAKRKVAIC